ncbi:MAG TPA: FxLYD domain-containing protein [Methylomirabilota bacterium]|jgi:hypothetical protein
MCTRQTVLVALMLIAVAPITAAAGTVWAPATLDQYFRVEWVATSGPGGSSVSGYVTNIGAGPAERVQLVVEGLDAAGSVVGASMAWVVGDLPANQRGYFTARVPAAPAYRVRVVAFDWANCRN